MRPFVLILVNHTVSTHARTQGTCNASTGHLDTSTSWGCSDFACPEMIPKQAQAHTPTNNEVIV
jgi:hypothetical protein